MENLRKKRTKGFSLIELIVVIAIMAIIAAVLAPSLLHYVEKSRAQKDDSAMHEVAHSVKLAMGNEDAYDEVLNNLGTNPSCYTDVENPDTEAAFYGDEYRIADEKPYFLNGEMYGAMITIPNENGILNLDKAVYKGSSECLLTELSEDKYLYNYLKGTIGDFVETDSKVYENSDFTIFISFGSSEDIDLAFSDKRMDIYGQWSGTNLTQNSGGESSVNNGEQGELNVPVSGDETAGESYSLTFKSDSSLELLENNKGNFIVGITAEDRLTVADLKDQINENNIKVYKVDDSVELADSNSVHTGAIVRVIDELGNICYEAWAVLYGDVNSDGMVDGFDCFNIPNMIDGDPNFYITEEDVHPAQWVARDADGNGVFDPEADSAYAEQQGLRP